MNLRLIFKHGWSQLQCKYMMNTKTSISVAIITILLLLRSPSSGCPANCQQCSSSSQCTKCDSQFRMVSGRCVPSSQKQPQAHLQTAKMQLGRVSRRLLRLDDQPATSYNSDEGSSKVLVGHYGSIGYTGTQKCVIQVQGLCVLCNTGYSIGDGGQCIPSYPKCLQFTNYMCTKCNDKFVLQSGQCVDEGCQDGSYYQCTTCKPGYSLTQYKHCQVVSCSKYKQGKCTSCEPGYLLSDLLCYPKIDNCNTQLQANCSQCASPYYLRAGACLPIPEYCLKFSPQNQTCTQCKDAALIPIAGICVDLHCSAVDNGICSSCVSGYQITQDRKCASTFKDANCLKMQANRCNSCVDGFYINAEGKCGKMPQNCIEPTCRYCQAGYYSAERKCLPLVYCSKFAGNICLICDSGFSLTLFGTCLMTVENCLEYSLAGCSKCPANYLLSQSLPSCTLNPSYADPNCQTSNLNRKCILCKPTFRLQPKYNNLCVSVSGRCKTAGTSGECLSCYEGYKLNQYIGDCVMVQSVQNCAQQADGVCSKCANRYYLVNGQTCKEVDPLCKNYEKDLGYCMSCYDGYVIHNNMCEPITAQLVNILSQPNSSTLSSLNPSASTPSSLVQPAYYSNCLTISPTNATKCTSCYASFYLDRNTSTCIKVSPECKTYSNQNGACLSCYDGYSLQGNKCSLQNSTQPSSTIMSSMEGCKKMDQTSTQCMQCIDRYTKDGRICKPVSNLCNTYNPKTGSCQSCYKGYRLQNSTCVTETTSSQAQINTSVDMLCSKYSSSQECAACVEGHFLTKSHQCIKAALGLDQNCTDYDTSGYCTQCKKGHQLTNFLCV